MNKDLRNLIRSLQAQGFTVEPTANGHYTVSRDGRRVATFGSTPSDHRAGRNLLAVLRRAGYTPDDGGRTKGKRRKG